MILSRSSAALNIKDRRSPAFAHDALASASPIVTPAISGSRPLHQVRGRRGSFGAPLRVFERARPGSATVRLALQAFVAGGLDDKFPI